MSDAPEEVAIEERPAPFGIRGSDGSERGPYADMAAAQAAQAWLEANHEGVTFTVHDRTGEPV